VRAEDPQAPGLAVFLQPRLDRAQVDRVGNRKRRDDLCQRVTDAEVQPQPSGPVLTDAADLGAEAVRQLGRDALDVLGALPRHEADLDAVAPHRRLHPADPWDALAPPVLLPEP
jgi:hypothetical protein